MNAIRQPQDRSPLFVSLRVRNNPRSYHSHVPETYELFAHCFWLGVGVPHVGEVGLLSPACSCTNQHLCTENKPLIRFTLSCAEYLAFFHFSLEFSSDSFFLRFLLPCLPMPLLSRIGQRLE